MGAKKAQRYFCPFCGKENEDRFWTPDHVIPRSLAGPKSFTNTCCQACNSRMSKEIEQPALGSFVLRNLLAEVKSRGHILKERRKRKNFRLSTTIGFSPLGYLVRARYDEQKKNSCLEFIEGPPELSKIRKEEFPEFFSVFFVQKEEEKHFLCLLARKIIFGTCCWLWGDSFSKSSCAKGLREILWKKELMEITTLDSSEHHVTLEPTSSEDTEPRDALENSPHHTIGIFRQENRLVALVNLFGCFEFLSPIGEIDEGFELESLKDGIVVIAKTTKNEVLQMNLSEYEEFKDEQLYKMKKKKT